MDESRRWARYSIELGERYNYPVAVAIGHEFIAEDAVLQGLWQEGMIHAEADFEIGQRIGSPVRQGWAEFCRTWAYFGQGELALAAEAGYTAIDLAERTGEGRLRTHVEALLSSIELERGDLPGARRLGESALKGAEQMGQAHLECLAWGALAEVRLCCGEAEAVLHEYLERIASLGDSDSALARNNLSNAGIAAQLSLGQYVEVEPLLRERLEWARGAGMRRSESILLTDLGHLLASTGRWEESEAAFGEAVSCCEATKSRLQLGHTLAARAGIWDAHGRPTAAREDLKRAKALFEACGAREPSSAC